MRVVTEQEFAEAMRAKLIGVEADVVTGPGRSGAVAAVYASHLLGIPFIPYGAPQPENLLRLLIIDTATESGKTLRKAERKYTRKDYLAPAPQVMAIFNEPPRVMFWYEAGKPQRYRHEQQGGTAPM